MDAIAAVTSVTGKQLTPEQQRVLEKLKARDREVRAHEAAHMAVAGALANGVEYDYQVGPDGKLYAVGGRVKISMPAGLSPEQLLTEARQLQAAADAPADPSGQDMAVAAQASEMEARAMAEISRERAQEDQTPAGLHSFVHPNKLDRMA